MARPDLIDKLRVLAARGSTSGERAAARAALERVGTPVEPATEEPATEERKSRRSEYMLVPVGGDRWVWQWVPRRRVV